MRPRLALLSLLALTVLGACQDSPSFRLRWKLVDRAPYDREESDEERDRREAGADVTRAIDCAELGINTVRVTTIDDLGGIVDERYFPCFLPRFADEDADVGGPHLDDGTYAIEVRGVQRDGKEWVRAVEDLPVGEEEPRCSPSVDETTCARDAISCDCQELTLPDRSDDWPHTFVLDAPTECVDGIDNDRDGLVDAQEAGCLLAPDRPESDNIGSVQFRAVVTLFGGTPGLMCRDIGLNGLSARTCAVLESGEIGECVEIADLACRAGEPIFFDAAMPSGDYVLELTAVNDDVERTTAARSEPFHVDRLGSGASVQFETDFGVDDFVPPVEVPAKFGLVFETQASAQNDPLCELEHGRLDIATVAVEIRDAHGGAIAGQVLGNYGSTGVSLDFQPIACAPAEFSTDALRWGGYTVRAAAYASDGTVCFTTDGQHGEPDAPLTVLPSYRRLVIPRVLDADGNPPPSCIDCESDADCGGLACDSGICR